MSNRVGSWCMPPRPLLFDNFMMNHHWKGLYSGCNARRHFCPLCVKASFIKRTIKTRSNPRPRNWSDVGSTAFNVPEGAFSKNPTLCGFVESRYHVNEENLRLNKTRAITMHFLHPSIFNVKHCNDWWMMHLTPHKSVCAFLGSCSFGSVSSSLAFLASVITSKSIPEYCLPNHLIWKKKH
jgi:hypothetical protein